MLMLLIYCREFFIISPVTATTSTPPVTVVCSGALTTVMTVTVTSTLVQLV